MIIDMIKNGFGTADVHIAALLTKDPSEDISFDINQPLSNEDTSLGILTLTPNFITGYSSDNIKVRNEKLLEENFQNINDFPKERNGVRYETRTLISWVLNLDIRGSVEFNSVIATDEVVFTSPVLKLD